MGRWLIVAGLVLAALGVLVAAGERVGIRLGRLPGDIAWRGKHGVFYFPLVTCLLLSALLTLVMWFARRK